MPNLIEILRDTYTENPAAALNMIPEICKAIDEGLIIELPCKVGDKLYVPCDNKNILETKVTGFQCQLGAWVIFTENYNEHKIRNCHWFRFEWLNKKFYLTREAAEEKLKERES